MTITLDTLSQQGNKNYLTGATVVGIVFSHVTTFGRIYSRLKSMGRLHAEDWFMLVALFLSYGIIVCNFYGLSVGLGMHEQFVTKSNLRKMNLSIWIIQRFQPPTIFCLKTSIILLYVRIFDTPTFRKIAWGIWIFTLIWAIEAWFASMFECWPVQYFWDKRIKGGHCIPKPLTNVGFSNGFISFCGDLFILCMPIPMVWRLQMNKNSKVALTAIFLLGVFVVGCSIIRLIGLFSIDTNDVSYTQVQPGVWTYLEMSIGITCGNLPLLRPLFRRFFDKSSRGTKGPSKSILDPSSKYGRNTGFGGSRVPVSRNEGFERMGRGHDEESFGEGSEVELQGSQRYGGKGIEVKTDVELSILGRGDGPEQCPDGRDPLRGMPARSKVIANKTG